MIADLLRELTGTAESVLVGGTWQSGCDSGSTWSPGGVQPDDYKAPDSRIWKRNDGVDGCCVVSGIVPGVMAQTGMETSEILQGLIEETRPDLLIDN